ncbi:MAG: hypothetical protein VX185_04805 [Pseudomonadota bacterium]|nr:hypothetical protein [Pseudomonadota bacterium]
MRKFKGLSILTLALVFSLGCSEEPVDTAPQPYSLSTTSANGKLRYRFPMKPERSLEEEKTYFGQINSINYVIDFAGLIFEVKESQYAGFKGSDDRIMEYDSDTALKKSNLEVTSNIALNSAGFSVREVQAKDSNGAVKWFSWAVKDGVVYLLSVSGITSKDHEKVATDFFKRNLFWYER